MKKILTLIAATLLLGTGLLRADEGMWMLPMLQKFNADAMRNIGCRLTPEQIYSINSSSLKDAIVHFGGGCTGEMISSQGLLVTNHHCGYSSIQALSSPEHNYLEDGFRALTLEQELPVPGLTVTFMQSMSDVTAAVTKAENRDTVRARIVRQAELDNPHCRATVTSFYNDNVYYLIIYKVYTDVRFVAAPPVSMGKFGGETDNWMWPRHTCDFSMFRVYAGADGEPAEYSAQNRPLQPKKSLEISLRGTHTGDFAFIMGYPGRTQRFQTAAQLQNMIRTNRIRIDARTVRQKAMMEEMEKDPAVRLKYANKYASSSNGWKKWQGEELAFEKLNIIGRQKEREAAFENWIAARKKRTAAYGGAIEAIDAAIQQGAESMAALTLLNETLGRIELLGLAMREGPDDYKNYDLAADKKITYALLEHYLKNVKPGQAIEVEGLSAENLPAYVNSLYSKSVYTSEEKRAAATQDQKLDDPVMTLYTEVMAKGQIFGKDARTAAIAVSEASSRYTAGLLEWEKGKPSYPDANSTMRLTYGNVKPYSPKDGVMYWDFTTANGILQKENPDNYEFRVPAREKELLLAKDYGRYADPQDGELHTCFLTNNDITGGNSGSPVLDADGRLIGLAFDGNWESMSSDVMFEPDLQRCICVDIRYVLWTVEKVLGAQNLIDELTFVK